MEIFTDSTNKTKELAARVAKELNPGDVLALYGDLGSGKTTFTRFLAEALGINARVQSPTFVIMRNYVDNTAKNRIKTINHIDLYRLESPEELHDLDLNEVFESPESITIIEWPELATDLLPVDTVIIKFEHVGENKRKITIKNLKI